MNVSLVVAQGVHTGKVIPITMPQFLIGRDPHCNLRPASPSISKQHCGVFVRDNKVFLKDYGSTNGTIVNGEPVSGEREVANDDKLKIGPLEFVIKIQASVERPAVKAVPVAAAVGTTAASHSETVPASQTQPEFNPDDADQAAAFLLAMDDSGSADPTAEAKIPDGTTVMDVPAVNATPQGKLAPGTKGDTSKAAADILSKYMRRPRT